MIQEFAQMFYVLSAFSPIDNMNLTIIRKVLLFPKIKCTFIIMTSSLNVTGKFNINTVLFLFLCSSVGLETSANEWT